MLSKLVNQLKASVRDVVLAGVAAAVGYVLAVEVIPKSSTEVKAVLAGALYAAIRAVVGKIADLVGD